jgi:hypothetical protein
MNLMDGAQINGAKTELAHGSIPILPHPVGIISGPETAIQRPIEAVTDATVTGEKRMADTGGFFECGRAQHGWIIGQSSLFANGSRKTRRRI